MSKLVYRKPCEHGIVGRHGSPEGSLIAGSIACPGGVEQVLDPNKVLLVPGCCQNENMAHEDISVADVLAVLDGENT